MRHLLCTCISQYHSCQRRCFVSGAGLTTSTLPYEMPQSGCRRAWKGRDDYKDSTDEEAGGDGEGEPPSFSRVDLSQSAEAVARDFPGFPGTVAAMSCNLEAGALH